MRRYLFNYSLSGTKEVEANSLDEAQDKFDIISVADLEEEELEFVQHDVLVETLPGHFEEAEL